MSLNHSKTSKTIFKKIAYQCFLRNLLQYLCMIFQSYRLLCLSVSVYTDSFTVGHAKLHLHFIKYIDYLKDMDCLLSINFLLKKCFFKIWRKCWHVSKYLTIKIWGKKTSYTSLLKIRKISYCSFGSIKLTILSASVIYWHRGRYA